MRRFKLLLATCVLLPAIGGLSGLFKLSAVKGQGAAPPAPTGLIASDGAYHNKIGISWDVMRGATRYQVFRNTVNDATSAVSIGTTVEAMYFDRNAVPGQTYFFWVRSENATANSGLSASDTGVRASGATDALEPPPAPPGNPVTATKAALGKVLFWDEQLSSTKTVACGTCHALTHAGSDPRSSRPALVSTNPGFDGIFGTADDIQGSIGVPPSIGDGSYKLSGNSGQTGMREQVTARRSMSAINAAYLTLLFWDGRASEVFKDPLSGDIALPAGGALESQVLGPPLNDVEMGHTGRDWNDVTTRMTTAKPLALSPSIPTALATWIGGRTYPELFTEVFGSPEITPVRLAFAIATYERTLFSDQTPFDVGSLNAAEARGFEVFSQSDCNNCHTTPLFSHDRFENIGVRPPQEDTGRFAITQRADDLGRFRSPSLRNVELRAPFMHNGRSKTLEEVVDFYDRGGDFPPGTRNGGLRVLHLSPQQKSDLVAFMKRPLTDPRVAAGAAPFDRPTLYAESMRVPQTVGTGLAGGGGKVPQAMAIEPALRGNPRFTVGIFDVLGGAQATLVIDKNDPGAAPTVPSAGSFARVVVPLSGTGVGNGFGSATIAIPDESALVGLTFFGRWYVADPSAAGGIAVSPAFRFTVFETSPPLLPAFASVSAASFAAGNVAPASIVAGFGLNLGGSTAEAATVPLPTTLGGVSVVVRDALGVERNAPLFFVSPGQINYQVPAGTALGEGSVTVRAEGGAVAAGTLQVASVSPGVFLASPGVPAASYLRVKQNGDQISEPVAQFNPATSLYELVPIDLGPENDQVFLVGYGTGLRNRNEGVPVVALIGGAHAEVLYAGAHGSLIGVDQFNLRIPRSLIGRGKVDLVLQIEGKTANAASLNIH